MNICVCIKQVPDTVSIKIDPVTHTLIRKGVPSIVNPYDTSAHEAAIRLNEGQEGKIIIVSMGPIQARKAIRSCLAVGADGGYLISDRIFGGSDTYATSYILSEAIKEIERREGIKFDLILCGKQAVDGDTAQVGPELAEHMGIPQITYAMDMRAEDGGIVIDREREDGYDIVRTELPAVVTVVQSRKEPIYPTIAGKRKAKTLVIPTLTASDMKGINPDMCGLKGSPTKVKSTYTPVKEKDCRMLNADGISNDDAIEELRLELTKRGIL